MNRRVVLTGLGAVTPCGNDVPSTWDAIVAGRSGVTRVTRFDVTGWRSQIAGEVKDFDGAGRFGRRAVRRLGLFTQYALAAGDEALSDAGFSRDGTWPEADRFGTYVGTGIGGLPEIVVGALAFQEEGTAGISPFFIPLSLNNLATGQLAIHNGAKGPSLCVSTACAVGNHSIGEAWRAIKMGDADVILAGGTEAGLTPLGYLGFMNMKALSTRNDEPHRASRPFDVNRDGFVMSEGAGVVVLEDLEHAVRRGARIYCEVVGYASTTDAHHVTAPAPNGEGAARCMRRAMAVAGLTPADIDYINAHGTSTPMNDPTESTAIRTVFGDEADRVWVSSTKGCTGHPLGAAGGVEAVATALALFHERVPPTANLDDPDPACEVRLARGSAVELPIRAAISNGFGFGGTNASLIFARWED